MIRLAPSILAADFARIGEAVKMVEEAGADCLHIDIMDGHFAPSLTVGPPFVASLRKITTLPLDVHLMVENPRLFIPLFIEAGADWVSLHLEATVHPLQDIAAIKGMKKKAGIALNPATPIHLLHDLLLELDYILVLAVNPGFPGQKFIAATHQKVRHLKNWINGHKLQIPIQVDESVSLQNMESLIQDGAEILVAGGAIFGNENPVEVLQSMREIAGKKKNS